MTVKSQTIKKLSVATVYGKIGPTKLVQAPGQRLPIMRVLGMAVGKKEGSSNIGGEERGWVGLLGQFKCTNLDTGEMYLGSTLFLPEVALTPILVGMARAGSQGATFAMDLHAVLTPDEKRKPGGSFYEYTITDLAPQAADDPIALLEASIAAALPAPTETGADQGAAPPAQPAPEKAPAKGRSRK